MRPYNQIKKEAALRGCSYYSGRYVAQLTKVEPDIIAGTTKLGKLRNAGN